MAKKKPQKKTTSTSKKVTKVTKKKVTKKKVAKKPVTKKKTTGKKVASKKKVTQKKITPKAPASKVTKKKVTKKKVVRKKVVKKTVTKKKVAPKAPVTKVTKKKTITPKAPKAAKKVVSDRVTKLRERLRRTNKSTSRITIPEKPLSEAQLRKIKSGLTKSQLEHFKDLLVHKRNELLGDVKSLASDVKNASQSISYEHMADTGTDNFEQDFNIELMESERAMIGRINEALTRIGNNTYGICVLTGKPISKARLEAKPWAKYSISIARELDRMGKR